MRGLDQLAALGRIGRIDLSRRPQQAHLELLIDPRQHLAIGRDELEHLDRLVEPVGRHRLRRVKRGVEFLGLHGGGA